MSWFNFNESLSSLKGQITNIATEVLSESTSHDSGDVRVQEDQNVAELQGKCHQQEEEIAALKKLNDELQATLQAEKLTKKNGLKEEETSWYWDPPSYTVGNTKVTESENSYKAQIQRLQNEISSLKERLGERVKADSEEELLKLREENRNLTINLEDLDNQHQTAMEKLLTLKKELQKNFEVLKQEHEELKTTNEDYSNEIKELRRKLQQRDNQKDNQFPNKLESELETLHHKYQNLERVHSMLKESTEKFQEENQDLHEENFKLQEQVTKLEHDIELSCKHSELSDSVPRERYEELLKELSDLRDSRKCSVQFDESNIDDNAKSVIENLKREINDMKYKLEQTETEDRSHAKDPKYIKTDTVMQLFHKYVGELPADYIWSIQSPGDNTLMYKLEGAFKTLNEFKKDIDALENALTEKGLNEKRLQTQIDELTSENELLTSDVQNYYLELTEMKKKNDFLLSEITALKNVSKLQPIIETHEDNLVKLESELEDSNRMNVSFQSDISRIELELSRVRLEKAELEDNLKELKDKYNSMLQEIEMFKVQTKQVEDLQNNVNYEQKSQYDRVVVENEELKKKLLTCSTKSEKMAIDMHIIENEKVLLTKNLDELKLQFNEKSIAFQESVSMNLAWELKLKESNSRLEKLVQMKTELEKENEELHNRLQLMDKNPIFGFKLNDNKKEESLPLSSTPAPKGEENTSGVNATVEQLTYQVQNLTKRENDLLEDIKSLMNKNNMDSETITKLLHELSELRSKSNDLIDQVNELKTKNFNLTEHLIEVNKEIEKRSFIADTKFEEVNEEIIKLNSEIKLKDSELHALNVLLANRNGSFTALQNNVASLENELSVKNSELEYINKSLVDTKQQLKDCHEKLHNLEEEYIQIMKERDAHVSKYSEHMFQKENEIVQTKSEKAQVDSVCEDLKKLLEDKEKEIKELKQSIEEISEKTKSINSSNQQNNDEINKIIQNKERLINESEKKIRELSRELSELQLRYSQNETICADNKVLLDNAIAEKNHLISLVTLKHNESVQYHNEIQRLNNIIFEQTNQLKLAIDEKDNLIQSSLPDANCSNCESLLASIKEKDSVILGYSELKTQNEKINMELLHANETLRNLTTKLENMDKELTFKIELLKNMTAEKEQLQEQEHNATRELERLRKHLIDTEENYTQDLMAAEQKLTEAQNRIQHIEERAKQSSNAYTSNSIRANQEVETLRTQIRLVERQRDDVQAKLKEAEENNRKSEAALANLQVVLEQFQQDKDRDIHAATEKIRNKMADLKRQNEELRHELELVNEKLSEALTGLQAATRLGDQLETRNAVNNDLREQVQALQSAVTAAELRYRKAISNQQDKVDKNLIKNLLLNLVQTSTGNRTQVLRVMSSVLDFNQHECEQVGLGRPHATTAPDSLATEFVRFLEKESRPAAILPAMSVPGLTANRNGSTPPQTDRSSSGTPHSDQITSHRRNTSTGSQNLLFQNIENVETSSQISLESGSAVSDHKPYGGITIPVLDSGVNQHRNTESAILKQVLKDM